MSEFNLQEVAVITVNGVAYQQWDEFTLEYMVGSQPCVNFRIGWTEPNAYIGKAGMQPIPTDIVSCTLGGVPALANAEVTVRQAHYTATQHDIHITAATNVKLFSSSVDVNPGEHKNQTLQQIVSSIAGKVGVQVQVQNAPGANLPFPVYRETVGQDRVSAIEILGRCRNMHLCPDTTNGIFHMVRAATPVFGGTGATLVEGQNILEGHITLQNDYDTQLGTNPNPQTFNVQSQTPGGSTTNQAGTLSANILVPVQNPFAGVFGSVAPEWLKTVTLVPELPLSPAEAQLRGQHEIDLTGFRIAEAVIKVSGWFNGGSLWGQGVGSHITLNSPSLVPPRVSVGAGWWLKGVRYKQGNKEGSVTELILNTKLSNTSPQI
jgi:prophage tail gpP-like protein